MAVTRVHMQAAIIAVPHTYHRAPPGAMGAAVHLLGDSTAYGASGVVIWRACLRPFCGLPGLYFGRVLDERRGLCAIIHDHHLSLSPDMLHRRAGFPLAFAACWVLLRTERRAAAVLDARVHPQIQD